MTSVLVVDDDAQLRRALVRSLRVNGYESGVARSYEEALQCVQQHSYDVVLTDLRMAGKNGIDLVEALSELAPLTKAILMSAFASARDSQRALDEGAVGILCKPFDTVEMLRAVDRAAESRSGFTGTVHGLSLLDMLQMFHCARRSLTLMVAGSPSGFIHLQDGQVVHATHGAVSGAEALVPILQMPAGSLETRALEHGPTSIAEDFPVLLERLLAELPPGTGSQGSPSDIKSIIDGAQGLRQGHTVELPPDPPFPDVFGRLHEKANASPSSLSAPPALANEGVAEFEIARDLHRTLPSSTACAVLGLREGGAIHWSGNANSESPPLWLNAVRSLLSVAPMVEGNEPGQPSVAPPSGELQLSLPEGTLLGKITRGRRSAILLVVESRSDLSMAWQRLRQALHEHESIDD